ncbi:MULTISPECIES: acyl-CoA dehydrogenase family protein [Streptomyces]|uniref:Acyl-CoA dehydrogenase family protein n=1 Tax=Streptomyces eurythermus TaxID=42237 RepID=A0ABW6Z2R0_9ACTN|nr:MULTISPECIES: acyl-CoA dehydrogenase family protein [Streptomyces]
MRRLGAARTGWLGVGWPEEYGGRGMTAMEQFVFFDEAAQAGVPLPLMALNTVGPTIMRYGTDEQKAYFPPRVPSGEIDFAIGYSEPGAGTDLASLRTRAVREGDEYVVNGQKIWTRTATPRTGRGRPCAPTPGRRRTRASPCCWCRRPTPATPAP